MSETMEKQCVICGSIYSGDKFGQGMCNRCSWYNNTLGEEHPNNVIYPNVVSLNKAKKLFCAGSKIEPSIEDFCEMFDFYSEVEFTYNDITYELSRADDEDGIEYGCSPKFTFYFKNYTDFINNAKTIDGKLVKNIWNKVENANWLQ